ncbi:MAG: site-specific integrase [Alphaproteobacteria bacterium]|nr:site-specific integrase [Alphaproteobacteria bacterium]
MRRGELMALKWLDIDFDGSQISVNRSLQQTKAGLQFKSPKSGRGRTVALPGVAIESLRSHRARQIEERLQLGPDYADNDLVFPWPDGSPWPPDSFSSSFAAAMRSAGLQHVNFHSLRHSHATLLLKQGVHPKIVSERLGHAKVGTTLDIYSHVIPGMQDEAAILIDGALRGAIEASK